MFIGSGLDYFGNVLPLQAAITAANPGHIERYLEEAGKFSSMVDDALYCIDIGIDFAIDAIIILREAVEYIQIPVFNLHFNHAPQDVAAHFHGNLAVGAIRWEDHGERGAEREGLPEAHDSLGVASVQDNALLDLGEVLFNFNQLAHEISTIR